LKYLLFLLLTHCVSATPKYDIITKPIDNEIKVMIIDTGVDGKNPVISNFIPKEYKNTPESVDTNGHGTHVFWLIAQKSCPKVKLIPCKGFKEESKKGTDYGYTDSNNCFKKAIELDVHMINYSAGGRTFNQEELNLLKQVKDSGIVMAAAAGNHGNNLNLVPFYPASHKKSGMSNIYVIGALNTFNGKLESSNRGYLDMQWELGQNVESFIHGNLKRKMTGTSQATAIFTSKVVEFYCK
jgi:hypothetical protein